MQKVTFCFLQGGQGWSESYYIDESTPKAGVEKGNQLAAYRAALLGKDGLLEYVKSSTDGGDRDGHLIRVDMAGNVSSTVPSDVPWTGFQTDLIHDGVYKGRIFLRGNPDADILGDRKLNVTAKWWSLYQTFRSHLVADGWKIRVLARGDVPDEIKKGDVVGKDFVVENAIKAPAHGLAVGETHTLFIKGVRGLSNVLGTRSWLAHSADLLKLPTGTIIGTFEKKGQWREVRYVYRDIADVQVVKEISRRPGRPFGLLRGRRPRAS